MGEMSLFRNVFSRPQPRTENPPAEPVPEVTPPTPAASRLSLARLRKAPKDDGQRDFFVPVLYDVPIKDDVNLMDVAPYRLGHQNRSGVIRYRLKDAEITIASPEEYGLPTVKDYDLVIYMISYLNAEMEAYKRGQRKDLPPDCYRPNAHDILKFCRRSKGGKQSKIIEDGLERLNATSIVITSEQGTRRETRGFGLIDGFKVVSRTGTGKVQDVEIGIPRWIYDGIVRAHTPTILTLHPDYFLLDSAMDRTLYRLARRNAGNTRASYPLSDVHHRSGSTQRLKNFSDELRNLVGKGRRILDYELSLAKTDNGEELAMRYIGKGDGAQDATIPPLKTVTYEKAKKAAPGWDIYQWEADWRAWIAEGGKPVPKHPDAAFIGFCQRRFKQYGRPR